MSTNTPQEEPIPEWFAKWSVSQGDKYSLENEAQFSQRSANAYVAGAKAAFSKLSQKAAPWMRELLTDLKRQGNRNSSNAESIMQRAYYEGYVDALDEFEKEMEIPKEAPAAPSKPIEEENRHGMRFIPPPTDDDKTYYTYFLIEFEDCGIPEYDYTICETLGDVGDELQIAETSFDDDTIEAKAVITGIALTKDELVHWKKTYQLPSRFHGYVIVPDLPAEEGKRTFDLPDYEEVPETKTQAPIAARDLLPKSIPVPKTSPSPTEVPEEIDKRTGKQKAEDWIKQWAIDNGSLSMPVSVPGRIAMNMWEMMDKKLSDNAWEWIQKCNVLQASLASITVERDAYRKTLEWLESKFTLLLNNDNTANQGHDLIINTLNDHPSSYGLFQTGGARSNFRGTIFTRWPAG